jgi:acyl dehydratase
VRRGARVSSVLAILYTRGGDVVRTWRAISDIDVGFRTPPCGLEFGGLGRLGLTDPRPATARARYPPRAPTRENPIMSTRLKLASLADLKAYEGQALGASPWHTLTFEDIVRFADATGDHQWLHVDRERAIRESPFHAPIAHGYFGVARIGGLFGTIVDTSGCTHIVNYGLNRARFPAPLKEGARYRLALTLQQATPIEAGADAVFVATIEVEGERKPACVAEVVYRMFFAG